MKKNKLFSILFFAIVPIIFNSCIDENKDYLNVNPTSLYFAWDDDYDKGQSVVVSSNNYISHSNISTSATWCHAMLNTGRKELLVYPDKNTSSNSRSASVVVSQGSLQRTIEVYQAGLSSLSAPTNVSAYVPIGKDYVVIGWNTVAGAMDYRVYRSNNADGPYTLINTSGGVYSEYHISTCDTRPNHGANYYKIKAIREPMESEYSNYAFCNFGQ